MADGLQHKKELQNKFQRLIRLVTRLQNTTGMTVVQLSSELDTDKRNIQRDIKQLRSYNYPIESSEHIEKTPRYWMSNQRQAATLLDLEETLALTMAVALSDASGLGSVTRRGWDKLNYAVINGQERRAKTELPALLSAQFGWSLSATIMQDLSKALVDRYRLRILYRKRSELEHQWRLIEPWQMFFQERWYVRAWDCNKQEVRTFRPDRIDRLELLPEQFIMPDGQQAANPHFHKWDLGSQQPTRVHCLVSPALALWLQENPVHPSQLLDGQNFYLEVADIEALGSWLIGLSDCQVLSPEALRENLRTRAMTWLKSLQ